MTFKVDITLRKPGHRTINVVVPRGMLFEVQNPALRIQNLLVTKDYSLTIPARKTITVEIDCYCANQPYSPPQNTPMNVTPFIVQATLDSQQATWDYFSNV